MPNEVSTLQSVQDNIKNRIRAEFANLIPDNLWAKMVSEVISDFISDKHHGNYNFVEAPIKALIREEITAIAKGHVRAKLDELGQNQWDGYGNMIASEALKALIKDNFPTIISAIQAGFADMIVQSALNHMRNSMNR